MFIEVSTHDVDLWNETSSPYNWLELNDKSSEMNLP